jgi:hypothetical protein
MWLFTNFFDVHSVVAGFVDILLPLLSDWLVRVEGFEICFGNSFQN